MAQVITYLLEHYGLFAAAFIVICIILCKICQMLIKIANNHLAHLSADIKEVLKKVGVIEEKLDSTVNRVSHIEGKLGIGE